VPLRMSEIADPEKARERLNRMNPGTPEAPEVSEDTEATEIPETPSDPEVLAEKAKTPRQRWLEELDLSEVTEREVYNVVDALLSRGFYEETYKIQETVFSLRTRSTRDADRLMDLLQEARPNTSSQLAHIVSRVNLAASMSRFGSKQFVFSKPGSSAIDKLEEEWTDRYRFCTDLPEHLFYLMGQVLSKFDAKVSLAGDARSIENF
jgi:hypothetical protein